MSTTLEGLDALPGHCFGTFKLPDEVAFIATHGKGPRLWTLEGKSMIDYVLGSGPMLIGHCHPKVVEAIKKQADRGTTFYVMNDMAPALAGRIRRHVPCAEAVKFVSDGTEATSYAMRFARAFTGRELVLKFEGGYHGHHDYALHGLKASKANYPVAIPDSAGIPSEVSATMMVCPYNDIEAARSVVEPIADKIAAIIVEPVQRSIPPIKGFLEGLRALCDRIGAVLIFDEVVTGFRLALGGGQEVFGVKPDLCSLGKAIGGGLPLAALAGRRDILELGVPGRSDGKYVYISGTLNGNPISAAAGIATLDVLEQENGPELLRKNGEKLIEGMTDAARRLSIPFQMIGPAAIAEPVFGTATVTDLRSYNAANRNAARAFGIEMIKRGVFMNPIAKMYVSTVHDDTTIQETCDAAYAAMKAVREQGLVA